MTAPRTTNQVKSGIEVVIVGSTMLAASEPMLAQDGPVRVRHMVSIDELLAYIENSEVDCAVVDQSHPAESRGLKLTLLAASRRIRHLIVLAPPGLCAGFEAMHGVHRVLRTPIAPRQIFAAVYDHAAAVLGRPSASSLGRIAGSRSNTEMDGTIRQCHPQRRHPDTSPPLHNG